MTRGQTIAAQALARRARWRVTEIVFWVLAFAALFLPPGKHLLLNEVAILALFALSLDLILGYAGIISLGHAAFFGTGAYAAGLFCKLVTPDPLAGLSQPSRQPRCWGCSPASSCCAAAISRASW